MQQFWQGAHDALLEALTRVLDVFCDHSGDSRVAKEARSRIGEDKILLIRSCGGGGGESVL